MLAQVRKNSSLFTLLFEALQCSFEILIVVDDDFRQKVLPPWFGLVARG
jgi:hypothetical protein